MPKARLKLMIDKREQKPLEFCEGTFEAVEYESYPVGDYWALIAFGDGEEFDQEVPVVFERKAIGDLFGTLTNGYERFKNEMEKAREFGIHLILVIEGSMRDVAKGYPHSSISGATILKKLAMLHVRYGLVYHFFNDRIEMARFITETFDAIRRNYSKCGTSLNPAASVTESSDDGGIPRSGLPTFSTPTTVPHTEFIKDPEEETKDE